MGLSEEMKDSSTFGYMLEELPALVMVCRKGDNQI